MNNKVIQEIISRLNSLEVRIKRLEGAGGVPDKDSGKKAPSKKTSTLPEIVRGKAFKNGQERVAIIVGYNEKILDNTSIKVDDIKRGWISGKLDGKFRTILLERAVDDSLVRDLENGTFDLSQTGEKFFKNFLKSDARDS